MKLFGPLVRITAFAGLAVSSLFAAAPVLAGPGEIALLESYVGSWRGRGTLVGAEAETVVCRLGLTKGNQGKVNYSGRCALAGRTLSVKGTLAYVDTSRRFEAAMTTNAGFTGLAVGERKADAVIFNLRERETDEEGNDVTITAGITLTQEQISVDFRVVFNETGSSISAVIPFAK
jgi:hypothetical protein